MRGKRKKEEELWANGEKKGREEGRMNVRSTKKGKEERRERENE